MTRKNKIETRKPRHPNNLPFLVPIHRKVVQDFCYLQSIQGPIFELVLRYQSSW